MFHGARDIKICQNRHCRRRRRHHHHHVAIMELGHLSIRLGLTHPEVFSVVFSGPFRLVAVCVFFNDTR